MFRATHPPLRYVRALRRSHLARLAAAGAIVVVPAACGSSDADVFDQAQVTASGSTASEATTSELATTETSTSSSSVDTEAAASDTATASSTPSTTTTADTETAPETDAVVPAASEMVVDFTYTADSAQAHNPYIAVWVEDADGNLVQTISVWYQSGKGERWINDLRSWYEAYSSSGGDLLTSGATRSPGSYSVVWDGTGPDGEPVAAGDYVVLVESAREHGPYSITSAAIALGGDGFSVSLADDGELSAVTATMSA